jgi:hypothetical protein
MAAFTKLFKITLRVTSDRNISRKLFRVNELTHFQLNFFILKIFLRCCLEFREIDLRRLITNK